MQKQAALMALVGTLALSASDSSAAILGNDDRHEVTASVAMETLARGTALMVSPIYLLQNSLGGINLDFTPLTDGGNYGVCSSERFAAQPANPVACTGFLIAPDLLVTAGHCTLNFGVASKEVTPHCESFQWVFDYQIDRAGKVPLIGLSSEKIAKCKRVLYAVHESQYDAPTDHHRFLQDFAIIELDRPMTGRPLFKLAGQEIALGEKLKALGYPSGLPAKYADNGRAIEVSDPNYAITTLDVLGGNSGSPVLNERNEVAGILVRAFPDRDYVVAPGAQCSKPNRCREDGSGCVENEGKYPVGAQVQKIKALVEKLP